MALFIRDNAVDALAAELQKALKAPSKKEAVRQALSNELKRARNAKPLRERLTRAQATAASIGKLDPKFDMKAYTDKMWDDL